MTNLQRLGLMVKSFRESTGVTQKDFSEKFGSNRTAIAHLEQGRKIPKGELLSDICKELKIPEVFWTQFTEEEHAQRIKFESILSELVGVNVSLDTLSTIEIKEAEKHIELLFSNIGNENQRFDNLSRCFIFYGVKKISKLFFEKYFIADTFNNIDGFLNSVKKYQEDAIKVFSTYALAYEEINKSDNSFNEYLKHLEINNLDAYKYRNPWICINNIPNVDLPFLGYISAQKVAQESIQRNELIVFIGELEKEFGTDGKINKEVLLKKYDIKRINKMDTLLRKFNAKFEHSLVSSLFEIDMDLIIREKKHLAPKGEAEIFKMQATQDQAFANLSNYLTADYMDLYIATSMRTDGDFVSVNDFIEKLLDHNIIKELNLRYFNPTQSWIEDRVAKGLVEALMLKRADITIYMAQKSDTFGKDSEASVSLGQGKPVLVYVPKLEIKDIGLDSENLSSLGKVELSKILRENSEGCDEENGDCDEQALLGAVISQYLDSTTDEILIEAVRTYWAEFDLESEEVRIKNDSKNKELLEKREFRDFIEKIKNDEQSIRISETLSKHLKDIFIATTVRYEQRAKVFKEVHPLALQVILSTGVLNGILVTRSLESCANLIYGLLENSLSLKLEDDTDNYKLIEETTGSVIRVISKNILLSHAFEQFYKYEE